MTNRNPDYHCAVCRRYLFSARHNDYAYQDKLSKQRLLCESCKKKEKK